MIKSFALQRPSKTKDFSYQPFLQKYLCLKLLGHFQVDTFIDTGLQKGPLKQIEENS